MRSSTLAKRGALCSIAQKKKKKVSRSLLLSFQITPFFSTPRLFTIEKEFPENRLESRWNTPLGSFQRKISGSNGTSEKVVLFFRTEYSKRKFVFDFFKAIFDTSFRPSRSFFELICASGKRDSGAKFPSPEF